MTQTTTENIDVTTYAAAVRSALADLSSAQRDELLDDLEGHLAEVAAESPGPLVSRLGTPQEYAAELRTSAGLPPLARHRSPGWTAPPARLVAAVTDHAWYRATRDFLPELRPAWWVVRGYLVVLVASAVLFEGRLAALPIPSIRGRLLGLVALVVAIPGSVVVGRRWSGVNGGTRGMRRMLVAANIVLVLASVVVGGHLRNRIEYGSSSSSSFAVPSGPVYLSGANGEISNIYPYSSTGQPLTGVLLYDQDGQPIDSLSPYGNQGTIDSQLPVAADGQPITNSYPRRQQIVQDNGIPGQPTVAPVVPPRVALPTLASPAPASPVPTVARPAQASPAVRAEPSPGLSTVPRPGPAG